MKDEEGRTIIRPSSLSSYGDTARRTAAASILRDEIKAAGYEIRDFANTVASTVGTSVHRGTELMLLDKMHGRYGTGSVSMATDGAVERFRELLIQGVVFDKTSPNTSSAEKQIAKMAKVFAHWSVPEIEPLSLEERLTVDLGDGFILSGQTDIIAMGPDAIEDVKTGVVSRTHAAQLGAYSTIHRAHGRPIKLARTRFIKRVAADKDVPPPVVTNYELWDIEPITFNRIRRVKQDVTEFRRLVSVGSADPINAFDCSPSSFLCAERTCPLWGTDGCAEWKFKEHSN